MCESLKQKLFLGLTILTVSCSLWAQKPHPPEVQKEWDEKVAEAMPSVKVVIKPKKIRKINLCIFLLSLDQ